MRTQVLNYEADGLAMQGWLSFDETQTAPCPGVLVFPAMPGPGAQVRNAAERLASLGYVGLACDVWGGGKFYDDLAEAGPLLTALRARPGATRIRAQGAMTALMAQPQVDASKIAAIGYCLGGKMALELARGGAPLGAAVGFHANLWPDSHDETFEIKAKILACTGSEDPEVKLEARNDFEAEMRKRGADWRLNVYGGVYHSFTNPDADSYGRLDYARYDKQAHERSWGEMLALFDEAFGAG
jgi:dienelactone hydrolase